MANLLIVDDEPGMRQLLSHVFGRAGHAVRAAENGTKALELLRKEPADLVVSDVKMPDMDGIELLRRLRETQPDAAVVLMTAFATVETAREAFKLGADDFIQKPFDVDELKLIAEKALERLRLLRENSAFRRAQRERGRLDQIIGHSQRMQAVYQMIETVAQVQSTVLITGESGTGKELVARAVHKHSARPSGPFIAVNCGALTETLLESELFGHVKGSFTGAVANKRGIFEQAEGGTVFLDEISETSPSLQVKLLRVLQEREVTPVGGHAPVEVRARVIAASNADLESLCARGEFRRDLLYRLNVINIHLPPLRERRDDIPLLVSHLLRKHAPEEQPPPTLDDEALARLVEYSWPGNIRELENVIERAITLNQGGRITAADLPPKVLGEDQEGAHIVRAATGDATGFFEGIPTIDEVERRHLLRVLEATGGNKKRAAEILGINRRTLYRMAERFGIEI